VDQFYTTFLHHSADSAGAMYWVNAMLNGASEESVMVGFLTSPEYQASHSDDTTFVQGLYSDVLGRAADAAGQSFWVQALAGGMSRTAVAQSFLTSAEADRRVLDEYYTNFLGRSPDAAGELYWLTQLQSGQASFASVGEAFLASGEFFTRVNQG
jgi:hypothetical protein